MFSVIEGDVALMDSNGNFAGFVLDGSTYRVQTDSKIAKGSSGLVHLETIDVSAGLGRLKTTLYTADGDPVAFNSVGPNPESIKNDYVRNGGSENLLVDGSVTAKEFTYLADPTNDISLIDINFVMASNSITFGTGYFGGVSGPLTNGLKVEVTSDGNTGLVALIKRNEHFITFASQGGFNWVVSSKDMMSALWLIGGGLKLKAGTGDNVKVTVQDDIDSAAVYFTCNVKGNKLGT